MKNVLLLVSTILLFVCCTSSKERKTLQQAESVVYTTPDSANYGHENEMYKEPMNLKRGKGVYMRELRECGGRTEDKTKCAKG